MFAYLYLCLSICIFVFVYLYLCICPATFPTLTRPAAPESNHLPNVSTRTNCSALHVATSAAALAGTCSGRVLQMQHSTCSGRVWRQRPEGRREASVQCPAVRRPPNNIQRRLNGRCADQNGKTGRSERAGGRV